VCVCVCVCLCACVRVCVCVYLWSAEVELRHQQDMSVLERTDIDHHHVSTTGDDVTTAGDVIADLLLRPHTHTRTHAHTVEHSNSDKKVWIRFSLPKLLRCDWLGRIGLLLTRAVGHLAALSFGSDRWLHRPRWVGWLVRYLDIYLFYVYGGDTICCSCDWTKEVIYSMLEGA